MKCNYYIQCKWWCLKLTEQINLLQAVRNENRRDPKTADYALTFIAYRRGRSATFPANWIYCASLL